MADLELKPDFALQKKTAYDTVVSEFENGIEQRRAKRANAIREWTLTYRNRPDSEIATLQTLFDNCKGRATSFTWLHPVTGVTYTVRFKDDTLDPINHTYGFHDLSFGVIEVL